MYVNKEFEERMDREREFLAEYVYLEKYGRYVDLINMFISNFRGRRKWEKRILPYLYSLKDKTGKIDDWTGGIWNRICFRYDYVLIEDDDLHQVGRIFPPILDKNGAPMINENYEWLENTEYIVNHYTEFVKVPLDEFIIICEKWYSFQVGQ